MVKIIITTLFASTLLAGTPTSTTVATPTDITSITGLTTVSQGSGGAVRGA